MRTLRPVAEGVLEACCLGAVVLIPLCLDKNALYMFEPPKAALLQAIAAVAAGAWVIAALFPADTSEAPPARWPIGWRPLVRAPLVAALALLLATTLLSTALSISPAQSVWGHPGRARGLLTLLALLVLFGTTLERLSSPGFARRLISALILPSIPIALYAVAQRFGYEVLPFTGRDTLARRSMSLFGEPVFLAAYLDLVLPLTLLRALEAWREGRDRRPWALPVYGATAALQSLAALLSESRGALLGMMVGGALALLAVAARRGWHRPVIALWALGAVAAAAIALGVPARLMRAQSTTPLGMVQRAAESFTVQGGGADFRTATWTVAERVLHRREPLELADGSRDRWAQLRAIVGYGPETLDAAAAGAYHTALVETYPYFQMDRAHNQLWDELLTTGVLGLGASLALQSALLWLIVAALGWAPDKRRVRLFWLAYGGCALGCAIGWIAVQGRAFGFLGLQLGAALGLALFISFTVWRPAPEPSAAPIEDDRAGLLIAGLAAVMAHLIEISFSFQVISTGMLFFVWCALLLACATQRIPPEPAAQIVQNPRGAAADAGLLAFIVCALGFAFIGASSFSHAFATVFWDSLTLVSQPQGTRTPLVAGVVLAALLGGGCLLAVERAHSSGSHAPAGHLRSVLAIAAGLSVAAWIVLCVFRAELPVEVSSKAAFIPDGVATWHHGWLAFLAIDALILALVAWARSAPPHSRRAAAQQPRTTGPRALAAVACALCAMLAVVQLGVRPVQADEAHAVGRSLQTAREFEMAAAVYGYADALFPALGTAQAAIAQVEGARAELDRAHAAEALARADAALHHALARNPAAIEHATSRAQLAALRATLATTPEARAARIVEMRAAFAHALRLHPRSGPAWLQWARTQLSVLRDPAAALQSARRVPHLLQNDAPYQAFVGQCLVTLANSQEGVARRRSALAAAAAYARAGELAPASSNHFTTAGILYIEAGMPERAVEPLHRALTGLPPDAQERPRILQFLQRAQTEVALARPSPPPQ